MNEGSSVPWTDHTKMIRCDVGDTLDYDLYRKSTRVTDARGFVRDTSMMTTDA